MLEENKNRQDNTHKTVRIVQITDTHLRAEHDAIMLGINVEESFSDVVALVRDQQKHIDCLLCTGDLSQDASISSYQYFEKIISSFEVPHLWLAGNHDILENMQAAVGVDNPCLKKVKIIEGWKIITLNSSLKGHTHGELSESELAFLDAELISAETEGLHVLISVHHNPVPVEARWLQNVCLYESERFFAVLDKYSNVKAVVFGHIHQNLRFERKGVMMLGAPSTCIQFHPSNDEFALDHVNPGYRWLELSPQGEITSGVERVEGKDYNIDFSSAGY